MPIHRNSSHRPGFYRLKNRVLLMVAILGTGVVTAALGWLLLMLVRLISFALDALERL